MFKRFFTLLNYQQKAVFRVFVSLLKCFCDFHNRLTNVCMELANSLRTLLKFLILCISTGRKPRLVKRGDLAEHEIGPPFQSICWEIIVQGFFYRMRIVQRIPILLNINVRRFICRLWKEVIPYYSFTPVSSNSTVAKTQGSTITLLDMADRL